MGNVDFVRENDAARAELDELLAGLDAADLNHPVGSSWTIASTLCHMAFWDERVHSLLRQWEQSRSVATSRLDAGSIDSINSAVNVISLGVPGPAAIRLVASSAAAVDQMVAGLDDHLIEMILAAGFERYLRRSLHRREHLQKIRQVLAER